MLLRLPFQKVAKPSYIAMMATLLSLSAFLLPSFGVLRKGFQHQESFDVVSCLALFTWYSLIFFGFLVGQKVGDFLGPSLRNLRSVPELESDRVYWTFTFLSALGALDMLRIIFHALSPPIALFYLVSGQANAIGDALHEDYHFGIVSLRYLVVFSASLALCRIIRRRKITVLNGVSFILLLLTSTARLILVATVLMTIFQLNFDKKSIRIGIWKVVMLTTIVFSVLSVVNFARNAKFYQDRGDSFFVAGISEIVAYLGAPFQVEIGMAKVLDELVNVGPLDYRPYVDIEEQLNANSAFVALNEQMGFAAWPYILCICLFMGFMFSLMLSLGKTAFLLPSAAILYASSELWRLDMFQAGIFITWFLCGLAVPTLMMFAKVIQRHFALAYPVRETPTR